MAPYWIGAPMTARRDDWLEFYKLSFYCRLAIRQGASGRKALTIWRANNWHVATKTFYEVWNHEKASILK